MNDDEIEELTGLYWDNFHFYEDGELFIPKIFPIQTGEEIIPTGFNTVSLTIDGQITSSLDWKDSCSLAKKYQILGFKIFWIIDLGLFSKLSKSITDEVQFQSLKLSLDHFKNICWKEFKEITVGLNIYEGSCNFLAAGLWKDELQTNYLQYLEKNKSIDSLKEKRIFLRDVAAEYLKLLAAYLPDGLQVFIDLNVDFPCSLIEELSLIQRERFGSLHLTIKNNRLNHHYDENIKLGCFIPSSGHYKDEKEIESLLNDLSDRSISFRLVPESHLLMEWDQLDYLILLSKELSLQTKRNIQGFCAAGGFVVYLGEPLNMPQEIPYEEFLSSVNL